MKLEHFIRMMDIKGLETFQQAQLEVSLGQVLEEGVLQTGRTGRPGEYTTETSHGRDWRY